MNSKEERRQCEELWARYKYLVLSKSQKCYLEIREYLKLEKIELEEVEKIIQRALALEENSSHIENAVLHIWGYFKNQANEDEKEEFFRLLGEYKKGNIFSEEVLVYLKSLLHKYPNEYLQSSIIFEEI